MSRLTGNLLRTMDYSGIKTRREKNYRLLAGRKIFVPTNWRNILEEFDRDTMEYDWAANVLPLPCDQRYGAEEMQYIADSIREWEETES